MTDYLIHSEEKHWYALYTRPKNEFKAAAQLEISGVLHYLPVTETIRQWSDRQKKVVEPVLKGYVFIFADERERLNSLKQSTIIRCVSDSGRPAKIPAWQIENLKIMLSESSGLSVHNGILPGEEVEILEGPFKGIIGKITTGDNCKMIAVSIDLLNRSILTHLPKDCRLKILKKVPVVNGDTN